MQLHGQAIRGIREARGISGRRLAQAIGVTPAYVSRLERGLVGASEETAALIAEFLDIPDDAIRAGGDMAIATGASPPEEDTRLYTPDEAALRLRVTKDWLIKRVRRGEAPHTRVGRQVLFSAGNLRAFIAMREVQPSARGRRAA
ncbi:helix-turn-helix domain-containing protein [Streptomycetaceae bacterium NBC_01309]